MVKSTLLLLASQLLAVTRAYPSAPLDMHVHQRRDQLPHGYKDLGPAPPDQTLKLHLSLTQGDVSGLEEALYAVSTPGSQLYRQFLSKEQVESIIAPPNATVSAVQSWMSLHGLDAYSMSPAGDWISLEMTVKQANKMLAANFSTFLHDASGSKVLRTMSYSVLASVQRHIAFVHPTVVFPSVQTPSMVSTLHRSELDSLDFSITDLVNGVPSYCADVTTPACLQALYNIPTTSTTQGGNNQIAVTGLFNQDAIERDLKKFLTDYRQDLSPDTSFELDLIDGGLNPQNGKGGLQANLGVQYTVGIAQGVPVHFLSTGSSEQNDFSHDLLNVMQFLLNEPTLPTILTTNYYESESDEAAPLMRNLCLMFAQLGARGTTVLFSSGDGGVQGDSDTCNGAFVPTFPSTCPYITSVGSTEGINPERGAFWSSGGFSNTFSRPSYQDTAVETYLDTLGPKYDGQFNPPGRAFPDLSAAGNNYAIIMNGTRNFFYGTAASSSTIAAIMGLLNDELLSAGQPPAGFLNPLIYSSPEAFTDITSGSNPGCGTDGYSVSVNYDPVTGMGTPIYHKLREAFFRK